jgi:hypothetical protein
MTEVFVSPSRHDDAAVRSMVGDLQQARVQVGSNEELGEAWWNTVLEQIRKESL